MVYIPAGKLSRGGFDVYEVNVEEEVDGVFGRDASVVGYGRVTSRYRTRARTIGFDRGADAVTRFHLARSLDGVLASQLLADDSDLEVLPAPVDLEAKQRRLQDFPDSIL